MTKLSAMNLHKDIAVVLLSVLSAAVALKLHQEPKPLIVQVDWAIEFGRLVHALTEPTAVASIIAALGTLTRYEIWKRRLRRKHQQEIEQLQQELAALREAQDEKSGS